MPWVPGAAAAERTIPAGNMFRRLRQRDSRGAGLQSYLVAEADINNRYRRISPVPPIKATRDEPALAAGQPASSTIAAVAGADASHALFQQCGINAVHVAQGRRNGL